LRAVEAARTSRAVSHLLGAHDDHARPARTLGLIPRSLSVYEFLAQDERSTAGRRWQSNVDASQFDATLLS